MKGVTAAMLAQLRTLRDYQRRTNETLIDWVVIYRGAAPPVRTDLDTVDIQAAQGLVVAADFASNSMNGWAVIPIDEITGVYFEIKGVQSDPHTFTYPTLEDALAKARKGKGR